LPNVGPYIYDVIISGFIRSSIYIYIYIYDSSSLRVKKLMNGPIDIRGNTVKNIFSDLYQRVTDISLKDDSVSTHTPFTRRFPDS